MSRMKSAVSIVVMIVVTQIGQTFAACKKDISLSDDLLDLLCKCRKEKNAFDGLTSKTRPAFTVSLTPTKALAAKEVIKFNKVWLNTGNIYDPKTGVFTVPMNGLYLVSSSMMSTHGKHLHCHMVKNGQLNVGAFGTGYSQGTLNAIMDLKRYDKLSIKQDGQSGEVVHGTHWSMFSAYLISE
ncbi:complement C1q-like protein 2 [Mytilus californianus]|uniref:complement C1q-like protein 2 n=1 Tax=Mytilus californianus TaxID=6549 RepID=UPI00224641C5|nr:complement C1q-like protein 2 [Mytilus californianus]